MRSNLPLPALFHVAAPLLYAAAALGQSSFLHDLRPGPESSSPTAFLELSGVAVFQADDGVHGRELWRSDGTAAGTYLLADLTPGQVGSFLQSSFVVAGERAYFVYEWGLLGEELWVTDGTVAGTHIVRDLLPNQTSTSPSGLTALGSLLFFSARTVGLGERELYVTDGTFDGTRMVKDIRPGVAGSTPGMFVVLGDRLYFTADDGTNGRALWSSDGTEAGTYMVADVLPPNSTESIMTLTATGGRLYFGTADGSSPLSPPSIWTSDGTTVGTRRIVVLQGTYRFPSWFVAIGGSCIFHMTNGLGLNETWLTDGTAAGTQPFGVFFNYRFRQAPELGGELYFTGEDAAHGAELWSTDGTLAGTRMVLDAVPGPASGFPLTFGVLGSRLVYFAQEDLPGRERVLRATDGTAAGSVTLHPAVGWSGATGEFGFYLVGSRYAFFRTRLNGDLWRTDGTIAGTQRLAAGAAHSLMFSEILHAGGELVFACADPIAGLELCRFDIGGVAQPFGATCPSGARVPRLRASDPVLGGSFEVRVNDLAPQGIFALILGPRAVPALQLGVCPLWVDLGQSTFLGPFATTAGAGQIAFGIPADPQLDGLQILMQGVGLPGGTPWTVDLTDAVQLTLGN